jgi:hypothetical protein
MRLLTVSFVSCDAVKPAGGVTERFEKPVSELYVASEYVPAELKADEFSVQFVGLAKTSTS